MFRSLILPSTSDTGIGDIVSCCGYESWEPSSFPSTTQILEAKSLPFRAYIIMESATKNKADEKLTDEQASRLQQVMNEWTSTAQREFSDWSLLDKHVPKSNDEEEAEESSELKKLVKTQMMRISLYRFLLETSKEATNGDADAWLTDESELELKEFVERHDAFVKEYEVFLRGHFSQCAKENLSLDETLEEALNESVHLVQSHAFLEDQLLDFCHFVHYENLVAEAKNGTATKDDDDAKPAAEK